MLCISTIQQFVIFIYSTQSVISCQIQDDLSLFYNMVAASVKNMDPHTWLTVESQKDTNMHQDISYW